MPNASYDPTPISFGSVISTTIIEDHGQEVVTTVELDPVQMAASRRHLVSGRLETWEEIRDYVVSSIQSRWGAFPRDPMKERAIFSSFVTRWGADAATIARAAVEDYGCLWASAPLSVTRFCKGSDEFFARPILNSMSMA